MAGPAPVRSGCRVRVPPDRGHLGTAASCWRGGLGLWGGRLRPLSVRVAFSGAAVTSGARVEARRDGARLDQHAPAPVSGVLPALHADFVADPTVSSRLASSSI